MNTNAVARHYGSLTPEERFRLVVAAGARGDEAEQARLANAGGRVTLSLQDHAPYALAFGELSLISFIDLLETAADYLDAIHQADDAEMIGGGEPAEEREDGGADDAGTEDAGEAAAERAASTVAGQLLCLALAKGFTLKATADGWRLFCERMSVPPFAAWQGLPGFDRLRRALTLAEADAFVPEDFLRWLNEIRPAGAPELTEVPLTLERVADETARMFRARVAWWGG
jgi:hypothetical protein